MSHSFTINNEPISITQLTDFLDRQPQLLLGDVAKNKVQANRHFLERKIHEPGARYYGINTGFGALCDVEIANDQLEQLQENLVMSHACGMGDEVKPEVVRLMMLLKAKGLSLGHSGVCVETVEKLIELYNHEIYPVIWEVGSLGASGDLAPLAHLTLPLMGKGWVRYKGEKMDAKVALKKAGVTPIKLKAKEGLALLNGTQFMSAWGCYSIIEAERVQKLADFTAAVSVDAFDAQTGPFHPAIQRVRNHAGQIESAANVLQFLAGSKIAAQTKNNVQDPYSFRCVPQVHGAVKFAVAQVKEVFEKEINAVTDNPLIFEEEDLIISGGNFHGEPLALALDYLGIAMSELASISERRTFQLISGKRGLPKFLVADSGLNSGLMIPQYTAAAIVSMNKQLATPASVDTITSSDGQEDHVSMGANAAVKTYKIVYNIEKVLAIELMTAMQALEFRQPLSSSPFIEQVKNEYRKLVPAYDTDRIIYPDIQITVDFMRDICKKYPELKP
ncbi:MAG: histidine ammonia-lyase [Chitinophagales bacterium]|nr:histidine ammonia-lyase [Chitinophagales bacterium]